MKCANAKAGIASVVTGVAVVLSGASAHATFLYLNRSHLISAATAGSASGTYSSGDSAAASFGARYDSGNIAPVLEEAAGDTEPANVAMVHAGTQPAAAEGDDAETSHRTGYAAPTGFRWMTARGFFGADQGRYSAASNTVSGSPAATSPAKNSPTVSDGAAAPAAGTPVSSSANPPSTTPSNEAGVSPVHSAPIGTSPISTSFEVETPIVGVPSKAVPEPSTVGLLGIGLLLVFVGAARGKRAVRR